MSDAFDNIIGGGLTLKGGLSLKKPAKRKKHKKEKKHKEKKHKDKDKDKKHKKKEAEAAEKKRVRFAEEGDDAGAAAAAAAGESSALVAVSDGGGDGDRGGGDDADDEKGGGGGGSHEGEDGEPRGYDPAKDPSLTPSQRKLLEAQRKRCGLSCAILHFVLRVAVPMLRLEWRPRRTPFCDSCLLRKGAEDRVEQHLSVAGEYSSQVAATRFYTIDWLEPPHAHQLLLSTRYTKLADKVFELSHRQRIEKFNTMLANLSEHHDVPKVGNAGMG
jgi:hypothetical protein